MAVLEFKSMAKPALTPMGEGTGSLEWTDAAGNALSCDIVIKERGPRGLVASSSGSPPRGQMMRLREPGAAYYVIAQAVSGAAGRHTLDLIYSYAGRRRDQREQVSGTARVTWAPPGRISVTHTAAQVSDISPDGLRLTTAEALPVGIDVKVLGATLECVGRTVYCEKTGPDFQTGIQFRRKPRTAL